jgi:mannose-1-phosphate guanylyltransferase
MTRVAVETDALVCVGVEPDRPATGYGYVRAGPETDGYAPVTAFTEKPDAERAGELLAEGALWNAGMFAWTPAALLEAARETPLAPLVAAADATAESTVADAYAAVEPRSVDHAVMERTDAAVVVPAREVEWDDLGTWDALGRVGPTDDADTVTLGETLTVDTTDSVVASDGDTHVTAVGVSDLVVAAYDDRVLVVPRGEADRVREAVTRLRESGAF